MNKRTGRVFLANVGANASHRFAGPLFPDGSFEFLPIPEDRDLPGPHPVRYRDLGSFNHPEHDIKRYIPKRLWDWPAHNDPEFETFTYGDNCETSPRAASLKRLQIGDFLLFIIRLQHQRMGAEQRLARPRGKEHGFYLSGFLEIDEVLRNVRSQPAAEILSRFGANAHVRRGLTDVKLWNGFWIFRGSSRSRRFKTAVPVTRELADQVFRSADGSQWQWKGERTDLQIIGSYTRSCRCVIDPSLPDQASRAEVLWNWIASYAG